MEIKDVLFIIFLIIAAFGAVLFILSLIEPHRLNIVRDTLKISTGDGSSTDMRIFFFSDLHAEFCFIPASRIVSIIKDEHATRGLDLVVFGGDIINNPSKTHVGERYLKEIRRACDDLGIPFVGVSGNHDSEIPREKLNDFGFQLIDHDVIYLDSRSDGQKIAVSGTEDSGRKDRRWYRPQTPSIPVKAHILIAHNPDYVLTLQPHEHTDAIISGHIHGGQIRTPFKIEFTSLRKDALPKQGFVAGKYEIVGRQVYISKGIGCVKLPMRLGAVPEVNILEIRS